jgi:hypothetical protein
MSDETAALMERTKSKFLGKLDDDFALAETILIERPPVRDNVISRLNTPTEDRTYRSIVAGGHDGTTSQIWANMGVTGGRE